MGSQLISFQSWGSEDKDKSIGFKSSSGRLSILSSDFNYKENIDITRCPHAHVGIHLKQNQVKLLVNTCIEWLSETIHNDLPNCDDRITEEQAQQQIYKQFYNYGESQ